MQRQENFLNVDVCDGSRCASSSVTDVWTPGGAAAAAGGRWEEECGCVEGKKVMQTRRSSAGYFAREENRFASMHFICF